MAQYIEFTHLLKLFLDHDSLFNDDLTKFYFYLIDHNILSEYLINHRSEVLDMLREFYTEEMRQKAEREDREDLIRKETEEKVAKRINKKTVQTLFANGLSVNDIAKYLNKDLDEVKILLNN